MDQRSHISKQATVGIKQGLLERTTVHMIGPKDIQTMMDMATIVLLPTINQEHLMPLFSSLT
jgi:hypothetical protein